MEVDDLHPCPSPEEEVPVSVFLDSFSAFGMTTADTTQAVEVAPDSQPSCQDHAPGKPTDRAEATASTEAAYELSEPLAKVTCHCWHKVGMFRLVHVLLSSRFSRVVVVVVVVVIVVVVAAASTVLVLL